MSQDFHAIFENGVLRPLTPLNLPELAEVAGTIEKLNGAELDPLEPNAEEIRRQQVALDAMFCAVDKLPQTPRNDGLSGRDHDKILYGSGN